MGVGELIVSVAADVSNFVGGMGEVVSTLASLPGEAANATGGIISGFTDAVGGVLGFAESLGVAYFQLTGFVELVKTLQQALFGQNAAMEQAQIAFKTLTGSAQTAATFIQQLWTFTAHTPFLFPNLVTDAQRLMAV